MLAALVTSLGATVVVNDVTQNNPRQLIQRGDKQSLISGLQSTRFDLVGLVVSTSTL